jgi:DNA-binding XRE family transcriptional regulator
MAESLLTSLKNEIARLARKVVKTDTATLQSNSAVHRRHIAELRRRLDTIEREVKQLRRNVRPTNSVVTAPAGEQPPIRFQARGLKTHRATLGISAENYGRLIGVSGITIYNWESGTNRPRASQLPAIAAVRRMGKREVLGRLEQMSK